MDNDFTFLVEENLKEEAKQLQGKIKKARENGDWIHYKNMVTAYKEILNLLKEYNENNINATKKFFSQETKVDIKDGKANVTMKTNDNGEIKEQNGTYDIELYTDFHSMIMKHFAEINKKLDEFDKHFDKMFKKSFDSFKLFK